MVGDRPSIAEARWRFDAWHRGGRSICNPHDKVEEVLLSAIVPARLTVRRARHSRASLRQRVCDRSITGQTLSCIHLPKSWAGTGQLSAVPSSTAAIFLGQNTLNVSACSIEPDASYHRLFCQRILGRRPTSKRCRSIYLRTTGSVLSPLIVFLLSAEAGHVTGALLPVDGGLTLM